MWCYHLNIETLNLNISSSLSRFIKHSEVKIKSTCVRQTPIQGSRIYALCLADFLTGLLAFFFHWLYTCCYHKHVILNSWYSQLRDGYGDTADGHPQVIFNNNDLPQRFTVDFHFEKWAWNISYLNGIWTCLCCNECFLFLNWKYLKDTSLVLLHNV